VALQFSFKLYPEISEEKQVFETLRLESGDFLTTWIVNKELREVIHTSEEVLRNILNRCWIVCE
jgi:hypothetical protein